MTIAVDLGRKATKTTTNHGRPARVVSPSTGGQTLVKLQKCVTYRDSLTINSGYFGPNSFLL